MPVVSFTPRTIAVYCAPFAGRVRMIADSLSLDGASPLAMIACLFGLSTQLSLVSNSPPFWSCSSIVGSCIVPAKNCGNDGPIACTMTFFGCVPVIMKPPIRTLSPVSTRSRVEMLARVVEGAIGVAVGLAVGVAVGVAVAVAVAVGVGVGVGPATRNAL